MLLLDLRDGRGIVSGYSGYRSRRQDSRAEVLFLFRCVSKSQKIEVPKDPQNPADAAQPTQSDM